MPLVAELVTKLEADTKNFNKNVNDSESRLSKFGKTAAMAGAGIALAIGTVAVTGFIKLLNIINETEERVSHLVDTASKFDATVGGLQKLEYIAKLSGGSLGDVEAGMSRIVMSLKQLDAGTESTVNAFNKLGLSQEKLKGMKIDEIYLLLVEKLKGVTNSTEQAKIASEIFGRSWSDQINIVKSDITGLSKEFESFGGTLTDTQAAAIDSYGDSVTKLSALFDVFKIQLTAQVAPALEAIVTWIGNTVKEMGGLGPVANLAAQYFVSGLQIMVDAAQRVLDIISSIEYGFKRIQLAYEQFRSLLSDGPAFQLTNGADFTVDLDRLERIAKLQRDINNMSTTGRVTDSLQGGLQAIQNTLQANATQKVDVRISTEKGLKAEVAESPEVTAKINELVEKYAEKTN
jgi:hypothetical protein